MALPSVQSPVLVVIFGYRRAGHLRQVLNALARDPMAAETRVRIFLDGPRGWSDWLAVIRTRRVAYRARGFADIQIQKAKTNLGLARSIVQGVTQVLKETGAAIILEEDIVPLPGFLAYMNRALRTYANEPRVMSVSATQYANPPPKDGKVRFLPITCSWGWGTWQRAWQKFPHADSEIRDFLSSAQDWEAFNLGDSYPYRRLLEDTVSGRGDTWAVRWYYCCFRNHGLTIHPPSSYVANTGKDGSGQHDTGPVQIPVEPCPVDRLEWPGTICPDDLILEKIVAQNHREKTEASRGKKREWIFWRKKPGKGLRLFPAREKAN